MAGQVGGPQPARLAELARPLTGEPERPEGTERLAAEPGEDLRTSFTSMKTVKTPPGGCGRRRR